MFRDDRLEYKNGTLHIKAPEISGVNAKGKERKTQKPKRTTKFDFSGTNYETCTQGHVACLEVMLKYDTKLVEEICKQAREIAPGIRTGKPLASHEHHDKYSLLQSDPEFLARASLFKNLMGKKNNGAAHKGTSEEPNIQGPGSNDEDADGSNNNEVQVEGNDPIDNNEDLRKVPGDSHSSHGESDASEGDSESGNHDDYIPTDNGSQVVADGLQVEDNEY